MQTDEHVGKLLSGSMFHIDPSEEAMNVPNSVFERDVFYLLRVLWTAVVARYNTIVPKEVQPAAVTPLLSVGGVLQMLRDHRSPALIEAIDNLKDVVTRLHPTKGPCSIMLCSRESSKVMNSLDYCEKHFGLALFNGRRHDCDICHVWHVLCLRHNTTGGHLYNTIQTLVVPVTDRAVQHGLQNIRLKRFCDETLRGTYKMVFFGKQGPRPFYLNKGKQSRLVPFDSFCFVNQYNRAVAWIAIEDQNLRTGAWNPVKTEEGYRAIMDALGWKIAWWDRPQFCS